MDTKPWYDPSVYPRAEIDLERVEEFALRMRETGWGKFPPIKVGRDSGRIYDGVHRIHAAAKAGVLPLVELVDDPATPLEQLALGAELNASSSKQLNQSEKRAVFRKVYDSAGADANHKLWAERLGLAEATVKHWLQKFADDDAQKANEAVLAGQRQETPEVAEAKRMLDKNEEVVSLGRELFYRGSYAPDTPRDKVVYQKQADGAVIDYSTVRVEGQSVLDLVIDLRRLMRRVAWVKEAPIFSAMTSDDVALFSEGASVLSRAATAKKSGAAPVSVLPAKYPQEQQNLF